MKRASPPKQVPVDFGGVEYQMDVMACRHALVRRRVAGEFRSMEDLADSVECSRSTVSRFFAGRGTSLAVALMILGKLQLTFDEVFSRIDQQDRE
jgi:DNA-binding XRE family transcriptional regulator